MTIIELPAVEVAAPAVVPYPFGLFSVPFTPPPTDTHWLTGAWWKSKGCNLVGSTVAPCTADAVAQGIEPGDLLAYAVGAGGSINVGGQAGAGGIIIIEY